MNFIITGSRINHRVLDVHARKVRIVLNERRRECAALVVAEKPTAVATLLRLESFNVALGPTLNDCSTSLPLRDNATTPQPVLLF